MKYLNQPVKLVCLLLGGDMYKISVDGKIYEFENHPYSGPTILNKNGSPARVQPLKFLKAASLWREQGCQMEDGLCVWYHKPEPIIEDRDGKKFIVGEPPPVRGK